MSEATEREAAKLAEAQALSESRAELLDALGVALPAELLELALTHRSYSYEHHVPNNERLEFLGDSVLSITVTERLYIDNPDRPEGDLAKIRARIVSMHPLADVARSLGPGGLGRHIMLGKGEEQSGGRDKASILADTMEAILGAVHLAFGIDAAREVVGRLFGELLRTAPQMGAGLDWKSSLQELCAERGSSAPHYEVTATGPDHDKHFTARVVIDGSTFGEGAGHSKREAEQQAAGLAWNALQSSARA